MAGPEGALQDDPGRGGRVGQRPRLLEQGVHALRPGAHGANEDVQRGLVGGRGDGERVELLEWTRELDWLGVRGGIMLKWRGGKKNY